MGGTSSSPFENNLHPLSEKRRRQRRNSSWFSEDKKTEWGLRFRRFQKYQEKLRRDKKYRQSVTKRNNRATGKCRSKRAVFRLTHEGLRRKVKNIATTRKKIERRTKKLQRKHMTTVTTIHSEKNPNQRTGGGSDSGSRRSSSSSQSRRQSLKEVFRLAGVTKNNLSRRPANVSMMQIRSRYLSKLNIIQSNNQREGSANMKRESTTRRGQRDKSTESRCRATLSNCARNGVLLSPSRRIRDSARRSSIRRSVKKRSESWSAFDRSKNDLPVLTADEKRAKARSNSCTLLHEREDKAVRTSALAAFCRRARTPLGGESGRRDFFL